MLNVSFSSVAGSPATICLTLKYFIMAGAGAEALAPLLGSAFDFMAAENRNENQIHLAKLNHKWNVEMWNANNAYNAPIEQKHRLEQAGINPYSVMAGDGADTGNSSSPAESTQMPNLVTPPSFASAGMDLLNAIKVAKETEGQQIANESAAMNLAFQETRTYLDISEQRARIKETLSRSDLNDEQRNYLESQDRILQAQEYYILKKSRADANTAQITSENLQREYDDRHFESIALQAVQDAKVMVSKAQAKQIGAATHKIFQEILNLQEERKLTKQEIKKVIAEKLNTEENTKVIRGRNIRESQQLRANIAKQLYDMLITAESNQLGILGTWRGGDSEDVDFIGNDIVDFIMNGNAPRRSNNVRRNYERNHPSSRSGVR